MPKARCIDCQHYYVTWDKGFPSGCRAMGFKSKAAPSQVTREASGIDCLSFLPKKEARGAETGKKYESR